MYPLFLSGFSEFSPQIVDKYPNIRSPKNPLVGAELYHAKEEGGTDRHNETDSRFPQFC